MMSLKYHVSKLIPKIVEILRKIIRYRISTSVKLKLAFHNKEQYSFLIQLNSFPWYVFWRRGIRIWWTLRWYEYFGAQSLRLMIIKVFCIGWRLVDSDSGSSRLCHTVSDKQILVKLFCNKRASFDNCYTLDITLNTSPALRVWARQIWFLQH